MRHFLITLALVLSAMVMGYTSTPSPSPMRTPQPFPGPTIKADPLFVRTWKIQTYAVIMEFDDADGNLAETVTIERIKGRLVITTAPPPLNTPKAHLRGKLTPAEVQAGGVGCEKREEKK